MGTIRSFALINCFLSTTPCLTAKQRGGCGVHTDEPAPHTVQLTPPSLGLTLFLRMNLRICRNIESCVVEPLSSQPSIPAFLGNEGWRFRVKSSFRLLLCFSSLSNFD